MKLEVGKCYVTASGKKVGPMEQYDPQLNRYPFEYDGSLWDSDGIYYCDIDDGENIVAEWEEPMKTWGEMTDAEKGALLLARHRELTIEFYSELYECWLTAINMRWVDNVAYRVKKPAIKSTKVMCMWYEDGYTPCIDVYMPNPTHKITFVTIDGEPDCSSIRMEKV